MQVFFKPRDPQAADLLDLSQRRTSFVLRRLAWLVPPATVTMSDVNGPRGGIDKQCQVELKTDGAGTVVVTSVASDWRSALDKALARAARFVLRLAHNPLSILHPAAPTRIMNDLMNRP